MGLIGLLTIKGLIWILINSVLLFPNLGLILSPSWRSKSLFEPFFLMAPTWDGSKYHLIDQIDPSNRNPDQPHDLLDPFIQAICFCVKLLLTIGLKFKKVERVVSFNQLKLRAVNKVRMDNGVDILYFPRSHWDFPICSSPMIGMPLGGPYRQVCFVLCVEGSQGWLCFS